jgi:aryl-alcohol dehydrogenase-like predicted oxidoreductase
MTARRATDKLLTRMQFRRLGPDGPLVSAVGLGTMLLSISARPPEDQAIAVIRAALDAGVTLIDSADCYCLGDRDFHHSEELVVKALQGRRQEVTVATKCGCRRPGGAWTVDGHPEYLTQAVHASLQALRRDTLDLLQLHAPDSRVPYAESVGALARLREAGKIRHVGLCNVTVAHVETARRIVPVACVQNRWNVTDRTPETAGVIEYCTRHGLAFLAYSPFGGTLGAPALSKHRLLGEEARRRRMSPYRLLLAWMLAKSPVVIPIPGARRIESILEDATAAAEHLTEDAIRAVEAAILI